MATVDTTFQEPISLQQYVFAGSVLAALYDIRWRMYVDLQDDLNRFKQFLDNFHLRLHAIALNKLLNEIDAYFETNPPEEEDITKRMPSRFKETLSNIVFDAQRAFVEQIEGKEFLLIQRSTVTTRLREFRPKLKDKHQLEALEDTIRCLEVGANKAAIVMAWNLAYDHIRQWVFRGKKVRLAAFNAVTSAFKEPFTITVYDDFFDMRERQFLEVAYKAKLFRKHKYEILCSALQTRNHHAHHSQLEAPSMGAAAYVENLFVNVITQSDFN
jgi:hypothetical protein